MPEPLTLAAMGGGIGVLAFYARRYFLITKEVVDITVGAIALVFALPVMALCAAVIKLSSRGPVLFSQVRAGQDGRLFTMYKFRTMHIGRERAPAPFGQMRTTLGLFGPAAGCASATWTSCRSCSRSYPA